MQTVLFLGPPGSGKTSLIAATLTSGVLPGRVAYIFNDEGTPTTLDAGGSGEDAFLPLTGGCFGCRDEAGLRRVLEETRQGGFAWCIIEPLGFIAGNELPDLLSGMGAPAQVITLIDAHNHEENLDLGIVESQLAAATIAVGVTKTDRDIPDAVLDMTARYASHVPIMRLNRDQALPQYIVDRLCQPTTKRRRIRKVRPACGHGCTHNHDHGGDHGIWTYHFGLMPDATLLDVQAIFAGRKDIIRVKGIVEGKQFHRVHNSAWERTVDDARAPFVTLYSRKPFSPNQADEHVLLPVSTTTSSATTRDLLRRADIGAGRTTELLQRLMDRMPKAPVMGRNGPLTNPETLEIINELRKRPGIPIELVRQAIDQRVRYYLAVLDVFTPASPWWHDEESLNRKRMLAIGIGWFAKNKSDALSSDTLAAVAKVDVDGLLAEGLQGMVEHNSDLQTAIDTADEVRDTVLFIGAPSRRLIEAIDWSLRLAEADKRQSSDLISAWEQVRAAAAQD